MLGAGAARLRRRRARARARNVGRCSLGGRRHAVAGRVCMDQFVVDLGDDRGGGGRRGGAVRARRRGEPTAQDWADAAGTISYEIVTRIGPRVPRVLRRGATREARTGNGLAGLGIGLGVPRRRRGRGAVWPPSG